MEEKEKDTNYFAQFEKKTIDTNKSNVFVNIFILVVLSLVWQHLIFSKPEKEVITQKNAIVESNLNKFYFNVPISQEAGEEKKVVEDFATKVYMPSFVRGLNENIEPFNSFAYNKFKNNILNLNYYKKITDLKDSNVKYKIDNITYMMTNWENENNPGLYYIYTTTINVFINNEQYYMNNKVKLKKENGKYLIVDIELDETYISK